MEHIDHERGAHRRPHPELIGHPDDLTLDTAGQLHPCYEVVRRHAGYLACGELAVEPVLGAVRVAGVTRVADRPSGPFVRLTWRDDHGPCTAIGQYPASRLFPVRIPASADRQSIRQNIARAAALHGDIDADTARLIAAHLHSGPHSALYDFAVDGGVHDRLFDELDTVNRHRPYARSWVQALARYCLARKDLGPLPAWRAIRGAAWLQAARPVAAHDAEPETNQTAVTASAPGLGDAEFVRSDLAVQLIDAAFAIGAAVHRTDVFASASLIKLLNRTRLAG